MKKLFGILTSANDCGVSAGLLFTRVLSAVLLMTHGYTKLMTFSALSLAFPDPLGVGSSVSLALVIGAEFFAAIFLALGFITRVALIPMVFNMAVIFFVIQKGQPMQFKELGLVYLIIFAGLMITGPGKYSIDYLLNREKSR